MALNTPTLILGGTPVRTNDASLVSLTDIHAAAEAAGMAEGKRKPGDWAREAGADFIDFVAENLNTRKTGIYQTKRGKHGGGTFAHKQIALAEIVARKSIERFNVRGNDRCAFECGRAADRVAAV